MCRRCVVENTISGLCTCECWQAPFLVLVPLHSSIPTYPAPHPTPLVTALCLTSALPLPASLPQTGQRQINNQCRWAVISVRCRPYQTGLNGVWWKFLETWSSRRRETKARRPSIKISSQLMQIRFTYPYPAFHNNRSQELEGRNNPSWGEKDWKGLRTNEYPDSVLIYDGVSDSRDIVAPSSSFVQSKQAARCNYKKNKKHKTPSVLMAQRRMKHEGQTLHYLLTGSFPFTL